MLQLKSDSRCDLHRQHERPGVQKSDFSFVDLATLDAVCGEFEHEIARLDAAGEIPEALLKQATLVGNVDHTEGEVPRLPHGSSKEPEKAICQLYDLTESVRQRPRQILDNRAGLLDRNRPFTPIPLPLTCVDPRCDQSGPLTQQPALLEPQRLDLLRLVESLYPQAGDRSKLRPSEVELLQGPDYWRGLTQDQRDELTKPWECFVEQVARLATPFELWSLGVWDPRQRTIAEGGRLATVRAAFAALPEKPAPLAAQAKLQMFFWEHYELVSYLDRRAGLRFGFHGGDGWWLAKNTKLLSQIAPNRVEAVTSVIEELSAVTARNGRKWAHKVTLKRQQGGGESNWKGFLWRSAKGLIRNAVKRILHERNLAESSWLGLRHNTGDAESGLEQWAERATDKRWNSRPLSRMTSGPDELASSDAPGDSRARRLAWLALQGIENLTIEEHAVLALRTGVSHFAPLTLAEVADLLKSHLPKWTARKVELRSNSARKKLHDAARQFESDDEDPAGEPVDE
jgi:hypothetical protein